MNRSFFAYCIFFPLLVMFALSCEKESDQEAVQALIETTVKERLAKYRQIRETKCEERVLEEANRRADSILIEEARLARDTMAKPDKPDKPDKPEIKALLDTTPIAPFLTKEVQDSILRDSLVQDSILQYRDSILRH